MDTLYALPGGEVDAVLSGAPTGLVGTLGVQLLDATDGSVVQARTTAGINEIPAGSGLYIKPLVAPVAAGDYLIVWDNGIDPGSTATDRLIVNATGAPLSPPPIGWIISLSDYKEAIGKNDTREDIKFAAAIPRASQAVRSYTDRSFGLPQVTEDRTFEYDNSGFLDIDDAETINSVTVVGYPVGVQDYVLTSDQWLGEKLMGQVYEYLRIVGSSRGYPSPEMGFVRNLDVLAADGRLFFFPPMIKVNALWGWPAVPEDIKQAVVWTVASMSENPSPLISETIENYSRTWGRSPDYAVPDRAKELLAPYIRIGT